MPMNDDQLAAFMGIAGTKECARIMATVTGEQRALYEKMADVEMEVKLWQDGLGPKPAGVIVCIERSRRIGRRHAC